MKEIKEFIKKQGYKYSGKSTFKEDMFEKGNSIIYISEYILKHQKQETFKEASDRMFKSSM
jgi:hypothetical protein